MKSRTEMLAFALQGGTRNAVITPAVKAKIDAMVDKGMKCNEIFKSLKDDPDAPGIKYQNVRSYIQRQLLQATKSEKSEAKTEPEAETEEAEV